MAKEVVYRVLGEVLCCCGFASCAHRTGERLQVEADRKTGTDTDTDTDTDADADTDTDRQTD